MKNTKRIAVSGIVAALSVVLMYLAAVTDLLSLSGMIIAAFMILFVYIEYGTGTALSVYGAVSVLSLLVLPDKLTAFIYALYAGYYPILKAKFETKPKLISWVLKLGSFNLVLIGLIVASRFITSIENEVIWIEAAVFVLANLVFVLADKLAGRLTLLYLIKIRPMLKKRGLL